MGEIYEELDHLFSEITESLSKYGKSKILQNYFFSSYVSFIYSNLINNFFINLNNKNVAELILPTGQIGKIKEKYKEIRKEVKLAISRSLKEKKIDEAYYYRFKSNLRRDFPEFLKLISDIEKEIDFIKLKEFIKDKKVAIEKCQAFRMT